MDISSYIKAEYILILILSIAIAVVIGFSIVQVIETKLGSVTINVPSQSCSIPPIYLSVDNGEMRQINLSEVAGASTHTRTSAEQIGQTEPFGNLPNYPEKQTVDTKHILSGLINSNEASETIDNQSIYTTETNPNYNTVNNLPLLFAPDTNVPNRAGPESKGYFKSKVKLIEDPESPLMKLFKQNEKSIEKTLEKCSNNPIPNINGPYDGYNTFVDLKTDSYANVASIGKSMLTPYVSYPVPS